MDENNKTGNVMDSTCTENKLVAEQSAVVGDTTATKQDDNAISDGEKLIGTSEASSSNSSFELLNEGEKTVIDTQNSGLNETGGSLCNLLVYTSGESDSEEDSDDSASYECDSDVQEVVQKSPVVSTKQKKNSNNLMDALKTMGELSLDDLPPVPDISNLSIKVEECDEIGKVSSIVDKLVMVQSIPNKPAYDVDTPLFLNNGKQPLGYIFDVIGAVTCPMYAIRFNSTQEIAALNISKGLPVYSAPKSEHTQYVFVQQLLKAKGSDASWKNDLEVPHDELDFSDDEAEQSKRRPDNRKRNSLERYRNYEKDMNIKNSIDTRLHSIRDTCEPTTKKHTPNNNYKRGYQFQPNYRPNYGFAQANTSSTSCAFPPPFAMPPFLPPGMNLPPFPAQNMPAFVPNMPPPANFLARLPPPLPNMPSFPPMQQFPEMVYQTLPMPPPNASQAKSPPHMMFPPDMGLPRPPSQNPSFVPNMPFYDPRIRMWHNYAAPPPNTRQPYHNPNFYPKRP